MSDALATLTRRFETDADREFLRVLYAETRADELAMLPWDASQKDAFLTMQWQAQSADYRARFPQAEFWVLEGDEGPLGRVVVDRRPTRLRLVDIALRTAARGRGLGTALLRDLQADAAASGLPLRLHVNSSNPARRLYARLGFIPVSEDAFYHLLEWTPSE